MIKTKNILTQLMVVGLLATFGFAGAMQGVQTNYNDYNSIKGKLDAYQAENEAFFNPGNYVTSEESDGNKKKIKYTKKEEEWQFADIPQDNTTLGQLLDALEKKKKKYGYLNPYSYVLKSEVPSVSFYISMLLVRIAIVNNIPPATIDDHTEKIVEYVKNVTPTQLQLLMESVLDQIRRLGTKERDKAIALATTVANNTDSALGALASLVKDGKIPSVQEAEEAIEKIKEACKGIGQLITQQKEQKDPLIRLSNITMLENGLDSMVGTFAKAMDALVRIIYIYEAAGLDCTNIILSYMRELVDLHPNDLVENNNMNFFPDEVKAKIIHTWVSSYFGFDCLLIDGDNIIGLDIEEMRKDGLNAKSVIESYNRVSMKFNNILEKIKRRMVAAAEEAAPAKEEQQTRNVVNITSDRYINIDKLPSMPLFNPTTGVKITTTDDGVSYYEIINNPNEKISPKVLMEEYCGIAPKEEQKADNNIVVEENNNINVKEEGSDDHKWLDDDRGRGEEGGEGGKKEGEGGGGEEGGGEEGGGEEGGGEEGGGEEGGGEEGGGEEGGEGESESEGEGGEEAKGGEE